jgi:hypothetical protein
MAKLPQSLPLLETQAADPATLARGVKDMYQRITKEWNNPDFGTTAARPTATATQGQFYFDTTLVKPIWYNLAGAHWVDATGTNV